MQIILLCTTIIIILIFKFLFPMSTLFWGLKTYNKSFDPNLIWPMIKWTWVSSAVAARRATLGASGTASPAGQVRGLSHPAVHWGSLASSARGSFGCYNIKKEIKLLETFQKRAMRMVKSLESPFWAPADVTWFIQTGEDETDGRPHWNLQCPHEGKWMDRHWSLYSCKQWHFLKLSWEV